MITIVLVFVWYVYAEKYNQAHSGKYTFNGLWPIWDLSGEKIQEDLVGIGVIWSKEFFTRLMLYLTASIWIFLLLTFRKRNTFLNWMLIILPLGSLAYAILWFQAFNGHDYYWIDFYPVFILLWILFFKTIKTYRRNILRVLNLIIFALFIYNTIECEKLLSNRWVGWKNETYNKQMKALSEIEPILREYGIGPDDKVISVPDFTINSTLYLMNQQGYCNFDSSFDKPGSYQERISQGAKYLVVSDTNVLRDPLIQPYILSPMFTYKNVKVFDLRDL